MGASLNKDLNIFGGWANASLMNGESKIATARHLRQFLTHAVDDFHGNTMILLLSNPKDSGHFVQVFPVESHHMALLSPKCNFQGKWAVVDPVFLPEERK